MRKAITSSICAYGVLLNFGVASAYTEKPVDPKAHKDARAQEEEMEELIVNNEIKIERVDGSVDFIPRGTESFQMRRRYELDAEYKKRRRPKEIHA